MNIGTHAIRVLNGEIPLKVYQSKRSQNKENIEERILKDAGKIKRMINEGSTALEIRNHLGANVTGFSYKVERILGQEWSIKLRSNQPR